MRNQDPASQLWREHAPSVMGNCVDLFGHQVGTIGRFDSCSRHSMKYLLIYDNPDLDERLELAPIEDKVEYLKATTDADPQIARYAVVNSGQEGRSGLGPWLKQDFFLLRLMAQITEDYRENRVEGGEPGGEQSDG